MTTVVSAQPNGRGRWAYVLDRPGEWAYVSDHRYKTEAAALRAGQHDADQLEALIAQEEQDG